MSELADAISEAIDATTNHAEVIDRILAEYGVRAVSPSPTNQDSATNVEAQEEVVSALWEFARNQRDSVPNASESGVAPYVHLNSVGRALNRIMAAFKYEVASIE